MTVRVGHNDGGQVTYGLTYRENERILATSPEPTYVSGIQWEFDSEATGTNVRRWSSGNRKGALFRRETDAGNLWAAIATDVSSSGDTDWLSTGVWAYAPAGGPTGPGRWTEDGDDSRGYRFGVFADGGDPFLVSNGALTLAALTGTATYEGEAAGVYSRRTGATEATRRNDLFSADATLTIDFSEMPRPTDQGAATGRIHNIAVDGTPISGNPEIALSDGRVGGGAYAGIHNGNTSMTFDGASWDGDWGAAFFGNPASGATGADRLPGSVAGTFGVQKGIWGRADGDAFIGAFGAHRTAWTDSPEGVRPPHCPPWGCEGGE